MSAQKPDDKYLRAARRIFEHLAETADARISIKLWDGSIIPLGDNADPNFCIFIKGPGVLGAIMRRPTLENLLRQYATGGIDFQGGDLITFYETIRKRGHRTKVRSLLRDRGIFLNHAITRGAKHSKRKFNRITPGRRFILKYIFPGSELDHIGHSSEVMEACGFEIHDIESWREHYALTSRKWCQRLEANKERAIAQVGEERFRMWIAYLAGVSFGFNDGSLRLFQTVATKHGRKGPSEMPSTRAYLYDKPF